LPERRPFSFLSVTLRRFFQGFKLLLTKIHFGAII